MIRIHNAPVPAEAGGWGPSASKARLVRAGVRVEGTVEEALHRLIAERDEAREEALFLRREREADVISALDAAGAPKTACTPPRPERRLSLGERIDHLVMARDSAVRQVRRLEKRLAEVEADLEEAEKEQDERESLDEFEASELETSRDVLRRMEIELDRYKVPEASAGPLGVFTRFADAAERVAWLAQERLRLEAEVRELRKGGGHVA